MKVKKTFDALTVAMETMAEGVRISEEKLIECCHEVKRDKETKLDRARLLKAAVDDMQNGLIGMIKEACTEMKAEIMAFETDAVEASNKVETLLHAELERINLNGDHLEIEADANPLAIEKKGGKTNAKDQ